MSKLRHLTVEELLFRAEDAATRSPLIEELVRRLRHPEELQDLHVKNNGVEVVECPVCEAVLDIITYADESAPQLQKAVL
jgi:hypothetical protein